MRYPTSLPCRYYIVAMLPILSLAFVATLAIGGPSSEAPAPPWCSAPSAAIWPTQAIKRVLESDGAVRERMYALPRMSPDSVVHVTDERVCELAARAYYRYRLGPVPEGGVAVLKVGNRYAVYGANRAGEWTILQIYSENFEFISGIAM